MKELLSKDLNILTEVPIYPQMIGQYDYRFHFHETFKESKK